MPVNDQAVGKSYPATTYAVGREKVKEFALATGETNPLHLDVDAARKAGHADVVAPPMFCVVYSAPAMAPAILDPDVGINFALMVHGGRSSAGGPLAVAGDEIQTAVQRQVDHRARRQGLLRLRVDLDQPARRDRLRRHLDQHRARSLRCSRATSFPPSGPPRTST
jgi:acyl dehydratase